MESGVLDIKIQADSVNTGSGMKDGKLKSKDFFNVAEDPYITFHSTKIIETGPDSVDIPGKIRNSRSNEGRDTQTIWFGEGDGPRGSYRDNGI